LLVLDNSERDKYNQAIDAVPKWWIRHEHSAMRFWDKQVSGHLQLMFP
jgi:hypothetical protein